MLHRSGCIVALTVMVVATSGCQDATGGIDDSSERQRIVVTGSSTVAPLLAEIGRAYEQRSPGVRVDVQTGGTSRGISDARQNLAQIGMASRSLNDKESDLRSHLLAWDGIGMIVHAENPIRELTRQQIIDIYTGRITRWSELGGNDLEIVVVNKAAGRSTLELFLKHFGLSPESIDASVIIGDNEHGVKAVAGSPNAIGYVSIGTAEYNMLKGSPIRLLPLGGVDASTAAVREGRYPLSRPLNLVTSIDIDRDTQAFLAFATSDAVSSLVQNFYFVPVDSEQ